MRIIYPLEEEEQETVIDWVIKSKNYYKELRFLNASLNGVRLPIGLAVKAKKLGLIKGVPDLQLPSARGGYFGLYIEVKRQRGAGSAVSDEQKEFIQYLNDAGYLARVCYGAEETIKKILYYLELPPTRAMQPANMALDLDMRPEKIINTVKNISEYEH